jgi:hypothetical protein
VEKVSELLDAAHATSATTPDIGSTARGLSIVLLFGAYEQLMRSLCRSLLESASGLRVGVSRLTPGFKLVAVFNNLQGVTDVGPPKVWKKHGPEIISRLESGLAKDISTDIFPHDGSFMRPSQVSLFCSLFGLGDPGPILREVWSRLDSIVIARNDIAHGTLTADEVGRRYSVDEMRALAFLWQVRWTEFLDQVERLGATREFYRRRR